MSDNWEVIPCANCGVRFGISSDLLRFRMKDGCTIYCPNGHTLNFKGEADKVLNELKKEIKKLTKNLETVEASRDSWEAEAQRLLQNFTDEEFLRTTTKEITKTVKSVWGHLQNE